MKYLRIGDFSNVVGISVKTIRFYEEKGLIKPAYIDKYTGYRYYDEKNIEQILMILQYKNMGFTLEEIKEGVDFAHKLNKKVHVTCNIVMHNNDVEPLKEYLLALDKIGVDAIITSSLHMVKLAKEYTLENSAKLQSKNSKTNKTKNKKV